MKEYRSVWTDSVTLPRFDRLKSDIDTDVLIVGGGIAGILCAYELKKRGIESVICEAKTIGSGTTGTTTAVISAQHDLLYSDMINRFSKEFAAAYLKANLEAVDEYRNLSKDIDCDFCKKPSYIYSTDDREKMKNEVKALHSLGFGAKFTDEIVLSVRIAGAVEFPNQGEINPMKLIDGLCKGLRIYEHTLIDRIDKNTAYSGDIKINAKKIVVASHFPIINKHGLFFMKLYQKRSYVIALKNAQDVKGTYVDNAENGLYFRNYKDLLLIGGGDHRTGCHGGNYAVLRDFARRHYPSAQEVYAWAAQDCISLDGVPYIGQYSPSLPDVYVISGFNEWGFTPSMVASKIICDMIEGKKNPYSEVFAPDRSILRKQLFCNLGSTLINFVTPTCKRCPHLGCALKYNKLEHTWDCPCHGSRFDKDGQLINDPAKRDAKL